MNTHTCTHSPSPSNEHTDTHPSPLMSRGAFTSFSFKTWSLLCYQALQALALFSQVRKTQMQFFYFHTSFIHRACEGLSSPAVTHSSLAVLCYTPCQKEANRNSVSQHWQGWRAKVEFQQEMAEQVWTEPETEGMDCSGSAHTLNPAGRRSTFPALFPHSSKTCRSGEQCRLCLQAWTLVAAPVWVFGSNQTCENGN